MITAGPGARRADPRASVGGRGRLAPPEIFHEILAHRRYLSEQAGLQRVLRWPRSLMSAPSGRRLPPAHHDDRGSDRGAARPPETGGWGRGRGGGRGGVTCRIPAGG